MRTERKEQEERRKKGERRRRKRGKYRQKRERKRSERKEEEIRSEYGPLCDHSDSSCIRTLQEILEEENKDISPG